MTERWTPGIGDPSPVGWLTVVCYFVSALLCLRAVRSSSARDKRLWLILCLCLIGLGVNKQLDLQSFLTQVARDHAVAHGWYTNRARYQLLFLQTIVVLGIAVLIALAFVFRRSAGPVRLALGGLAAIGVFVTGRAASIHHVDILLHRDLFGLRWNWLFELSGIVIIAVAAMVATRRAPNNSYHPQKLF